MFSWLKTIFRIHFGFSKAEVNGTLILLFLTSFCLLVSQGLKQYYCIQPEVSHAKDIVLLEHTLAMLEDRKQTSKQPDKFRPASFSSASCRSQQPQSFDINAADEAQLCKIKGIGPVLAARIVKFRNQLGGFISQAQYEEVYGLQPDVVVCLQQVAYISAFFQPVKLDINTADAKKLAAHPYITYQQARNIVNYRAQHGPFPAIGALSALFLIDKATLKKLSPYLSVSP